MSIYIFNVCLEILFFHYAYAKMKSLLL